MDEKPRHTVGTKGACWPSPSWGGKSLLSCSSPQHPHAAWTLLPGRVKPVSPSRRAPLSLPGRLGPRLKCQGQGPDWARAERGAP